MKGIRARSVPRKVSGTIDLRETFGISPGLRFVPNSLILLAETNQLDIGEITQTDLARSIVGSAGLLDRERFSGQVGGLPIGLLDRFVDLVLDTHLRRNVSGVIAHVFGSHSPKTVVAGQLYFQLAV